MSQQFVLHSHVVAHPQCLSRLEVIQEEVSLAWLQHGTFGGSSPIEERLRRIEQWHLQRIAPERIHRSVCTLLLTIEDILNMCLKFAAMFLPEFLRHILQPTDNRHAVACSIAVIDKALAHVFRWIVRKGSPSDRTACDGFGVANGDGAFALLHLPHFDQDVIVKRQGIGILLLHLS